MPSMKMRSSFKLTKSDALESSTKTLHWSMQTVKTKLFLNLPEMFSKFAFYNGFSQTKGDILCEMRFHVPNSELDEYHDEKKNTG